MKAPETKSQRKAILFSSFLKKCVPKIKIGIKNQSLDSKNLKETSTCELVIEEIKTQIRYKQNAIIIGCFQIELSKKGFLN
jgi:Asp/Glu/hydantoin racemase